MPPRSLVLPGSQVFEIFFEGTQYEDLNERNELVHQSLKDEWASVQKCFENILVDISEIQKDNQKTNVENWYEIAKKVMKLWENYHVDSEDGKAKDRSEADDFYVILYDEEERHKNPNHKKKSRNEAQRVFGFWCFNAGVGFKQIQLLKPRSVILTSGTLSPLQSFEAELKLEFRQKLENPHVISPEQVSVNILKRGVNNQEFKFVYSSRDNVAMIDDLGLTITAIISQVPGGVLLFFPSYKLMNETYDRWSSQKLLFGMEKHK